MDADAAATKGVAVALAIDDHLNIFYYKICLDLIQMCL